MIKEFTEPIVMVPPVLTSSTPANKAYIEYVGAVKSEIEPIASTTNFIVLFFYKIF